jgi:hypothetical protein
MSTTVDCPACVYGNHDEHVADWGLRPGLIGGTRCDCKGDCADRAGEAYRRMMSTIEVNLTSPRKQANLHIRHERSAP